MLATCPTCHADVSPTLHNVTMRKGAISRAVIQQVANVIPLGPRLTISDGVQTPISQPLSCYQAQIPVVSSYYGIHDN